MVKQKQRGFTLVELLIVIVIIGILAAIVTVAYNGMVQRAHTAAMQSDLNNASKRLAMDKATNGTYPSSQEDANGGQGLPASDGTTYQYTYNSADDSYCLTITSSQAAAAAYHISSQNGSIEDGVCAGHYLKDYVLGDTGPAGGIVFYDKGSASDGWRYLEAAPSALTGTYQWGCSKVDAATMGANGTVIGTGRQNTSALIAEGCSPAAVAADTYSYGGYDDWFLPSNDELAQLCLQEGSPSGSGIIWSSSSGLSYGYASGVAYAIDCAEKTQTGSPVGNANLYYGVWPARSF